MPNVAAKLSFMNDLDNQIYQGFWERLEKQNQDLAAFLNFQMNDLYLLTEMPGNLGDHFIWVGTKHFLNKNQIEWTAVTADQLRLQARKSKGILLIPGSGAFSKHWHEWLPELVIKASELFDKVIILPSGYEAEVEIVAQALSRPNVFAFARDPISYAQIKKFGRATLAYDSALNAIECLSVTVDSSSALTGRLIAMREDEGSRLKRAGYRKFPKVNNDISLSQTSIEDWFEHVAKSSEIVTDRLHVAVGGALLRKRVILIDPYEQKLSRYFNYIFDGKLPSNLEIETYSWLKNHNHLV